MIQKFCYKCGFHLVEESVFCNMCGERQIEVTDPKDLYSSNFGLWNVSTEADCEGRSARNLGIYKGTIEEIAKRLAPYTYYSLRFTAVNLNKNFLKNCPILNPNATTTNVTLDIDSGTWDMKSEQRVEFFKDFLKDNEIEVVKGTAYASVMLKW